MAGAAARATGPAARRGAGPVARPAVGPAVVSGLVFLPAAILCLLAVLAATALGPLTVAADSPLDRLVLGGGSIDGPGGEVGDVEVADDELPVPEADGGIPVEVVLSLAVAIVAGAVLARSVLRARPDDPAVERERDDEPGVEGVDGVGLLESVGDAARRGLDRLDAVGPGAADEAVLACWVELESAGRGVGSGRVRTDTPTDFARRLGAAVPALDTEVLADLRRTYSRVRFGSEGAGADDVARAHAALVHLLHAVDAHAGVRAPGRSTPGPPVPR